MAYIAKRRLKDGTVRWEMRVYTGRDPSGRPKFSIKTFHREKEAKDEARRLEQMRKDHALIQPTRMTFGAWLRQWLTDRQREVEAGTLRERTLAAYREELFRWVLPRIEGDPEFRPMPPNDAPALGNVRLDQFTHRSLNALYEWMKESKKSLYTIRKLHTVLRIAIRDAVKKERLARNWADSDLITMPKPRPKPVKVNEDDGESNAAALTQEQTTRFLSAAREDRYSALWHLLVLGGLRPSEAFGLKWTSVDLEAGVIRVRQSLTRIKGVAGWQLTPPKTAKGRRDVPLPQVAIRELRRWKAAQAKERLVLGPDYKDHGFVFTVACGEPLTPSNLYNTSYRRVMAVANGAEGIKGDLGEWGPEPTKRKGQPGPTPRRIFFPSYRVYDLRHTCATMLLAAGVPVQVVSERLGHRDPSITMAIYQHVQPTMQRDAVQKLEVMFGTA